MFHKNKITLLMTLLYLVISEPVDTPVIAILANPFPYNAETITTSKVNSQYVTWLEQSYATIVVIQPWHTKEEVEEILTRVNGVLWPGGDRDLNLSGQFEQTATHIVNKIIQLQDEHSIHVPLWGTCQGFELLAAILANSVDVLTSFDGWDMQNSMIFNTSDAHTQPWQTKMFADFTRKDLFTIQQKKVNAHYHRLGLGEDSFNKSLAKNYLKITSYAKDQSGKMFIDTYEGIDYPFFGVQFHPEMVAFKKKRMKGIPRSMNAVKISHKFSEFFLSQARLNANFMDEAELSQYNYINSNVDKSVYDSGSYYYVYTKVDKKNVGEVNG